MINTTYPTEYEVGDKVEVLFTIHRIDGSTTDEWRKAEVVPEVPGCASGVRIMLSSDKGGRDRFYTTIMDKNRIRIINGK